jgi:hypothetical protein
MKNIDEAIELTVDAQVALLSDNYLEEGLKEVTIAKLNDLVATHKKNLSRITKHLESKGIRVGLLLNESKKIAKKYVNLIKTHQKKNTDPVEVGKQIGKQIGSDLKNAIKSSVKTYKEMSTPEKVMAILLVCLLVVALNTVLSHLLNFVLKNEELGDYLTAVIVAPLTEESSKAYFASIGVPWLGSTIVYGGEAITYVIRMAIAGISIPTAIFWRAIGLTFHYTTQALQLRGQEEGWGKSACLLSVILHATYNALVA